MTDPQPPLVDRIWNRIHNHRLLAALIVLGGIIVGIAAFTDAVQKLLLLLGPSNAERAEYCELLVPLVAQLDRSKEAFDRWNSRNLPLETQIIKPANEAARRLLLEKAGLVHESLRSDARELVRHYDCWREEYDRQRERNGDSGEPFVFVAPKGCGFPGEAEKRFRARLAELAQRLGASPCE